MKKRISIILAVTLLFCMTACVNTQSSTSSEESLLSGQATLSETETISSETDNHDTVTSINNSSIADTNNTTTSPSVSPLPSQTSSVNNPYISYGGKTGSELVYINPAPKTFQSNNELVQFLKSIDLRENGFHAIADNNIYLTPRTVNSPKSNAAKKDCEYVYISTAKGGKDRLQWFFSDNRISENINYNIIWYTDKEYQNNSIKTPQDLITHIRNVLFRGEDIPAEIIERENGFWILVGGDCVYQMYDGKYLVSISNSLDYGDRDELLLLAQDIVFDKHTLK